MWGNAQPPVWLEEPYWKPIPGQQYLRLPIVQKDLPRRERRQSSERASTERSITPYRRYIPYRNPNPLEFRGLADERSGEISPYQYRPRVREPSLPVDESNNEGKYNLLRKFNCYFLINFLLTFLAYLRGRIDELSRQLNNANDELRELRTTFGQVTSYNELLVRENAELKRKLKVRVRVKAGPGTTMMNRKMKMRVTAVK